jgi:hypothetical protein
MVAAQIQALDSTDKHRLVLAAASGTRVGCWVFRNEPYTTAERHSPLLVTSQRPQCCPRNRFSIKRVCVEMFEYPMRS